MPPSCSRCCSPTDPSSALTASVYAPLTLFFAIFIFIFWLYLKCRRRSASFQNTFPILLDTSLKFPDTGVYHGYVQQHSTWTKLDHITIAFANGKIYGSGVDYIGQYEWSGDCSFAPILLIKSYKIGTGSPQENFGQEVKMQLWPITLNESDDPAFYGNFYIQMNKRSGAWFITPKKLPCDIKSFFPVVYSRWKIFSFLLLIIMTGISIIYWIILSISIDFTCDLYEKGIIASQIEGAISAFAIIFTLIFNRRFKLAIYEVKKSSHKVVWIFFYCCVSLLSITFGAMNMITADFLQNYELFESTCDSNKFECSVIWTSG